MSWSFKNFPLYKWLFGKPEKEEYPYEYFKAELNSVAKSRGIADEFNKVIKHYEGGVVKEEITYSKHAIEAIEEIDEVPFIEESYGDDEDFEFDSFNELNLAKYKGKPNK